MRRPSDLRLGSRDSQPCRIWNHWSCYSTGASSNHLSFGFWSRWTTRGLPWSAFGRRPGRHQSVRFLAQQGPECADRPRRGWSYVFYLIAGIALVPIIIGVTIVPPHGPRQSNPQAIKDRRIDWLGGFLITAGLCLFTYSLTESGITPKGWRAPRECPASFTCLSV